MAYHHGTLTWLRRKDAVRKFLVRALIALPFVLIIALVVINLLQPKHNGRTAEEWILELPANTADAESNLSEMGANALPGLKRMLYAKDNALTEGLRKATGGLPPQFRLFASPARERQLLASLACSALHDQADALAPIVIERLATDAGLTNIHNFTALNSVIGNSAKGVRRPGGTPLYQWNTSFEPRDYLSVFCAESASVTLPVLLRAIETAPNERRQRLALSLIQVFRVLGAFPQQFYFNQPRLQFRTDHLGPADQWNDLGPNLLALADHEDEHVRAAVVFTLGVLHGAVIRIEGVAEKIEQATKDDADLVRIWAARAIANLPIETEGFLPRLADLVDDPAGDVSDAAWNAIQFHLLMGDGRPRFEELQALLKHSSGAVRFEAMRALGRCTAGPEDVIPILLNHLESAEHGNWYPARSAFHRLSKDHRVECVSALSKALRDKSAVMRARAAQTLAVIDKDNRSSQIFVIRTLASPTILHHKSPEVVRDAMIALCALDSRAGSDGVPVLLKYLSDRATTVHKGYAAIALANLGQRQPGKVLPVLAELLGNSDPDAVAGAIRGAEILGKAATPLIPRIEKLRSDQRRFNWRSVAWKDGQEAIGVLAGGAIKTIRAAP